LRIYQHALLGKDKLHVMQHYNHTIGFLFRGQQQKNAPDSSSTIVVLSLLSEMDSLLSEMERVNPRSDVCLPTLLLVSTFSFRFPILPSPLRTIVSSDVPTDGAILPIKLLLAVT
jgi:hypothetical protein